MVQDAPQRYFQIREEYWHLRDLPWTGVDGFKARTCAITVLRMRFSACVTELLAAGHAGNVEACFALGDAYTARNGVSFNREKAIFWFGKAAQAGHIRAMVRLASALMHPDAPATAAQGVEWLTAAATRGNASAMAALGFAYRSGKGVSSDYEKAAEWFERAIGAGDLHSMDHLGQLHAWCTASPEKALPWLRRAADAGFTDSYWSLAILCADAKSPHFSPAEAVHWYRAIANSSACGVPRALLHLARMTRDGIGTEQNFSLARTYLETALTLRAPKEVRRDLERMLADMNGSFL